MKKKNIVVAIIIVIALAVGVGGKVFADNVKQKQKTYDTLEKFFTDEIKGEDIDYKSLGKYENSVRDIVKKADKITEDTKKIEVELSQYKVQGIMDSKYLRDPEAGKKNIQEISKLGIEFEQTFQTDVKELTESIEKMPISQKEKEILRNSYDSEIKASMDELKSYSELIKGAFSKTEALFDYLISKKGSYSVQGGQIMFNSQKDVDGYNKLVSELNSLVNNLK